MFTKSLFKGTDNVMRLQERTFTGEEPNTRTLDRSCGKAMAPSPAEGSYRHASGAHELVFPMSDGGVPRRRSGCVMCRAVNNFPGERALRPLALHAFRRGRANDPRLG
mmetsp:Transcript_14102/g.38616  ORF Transcript_14102/g.38616 Transcript_14102/m.38616 type:complete len:108 (+) Transcript_14102:26-349(+)